MYTGAMQSHATTVKQYLAELPEDRREALTAVRQVILENLDKGFQERMAYGMIGYSVPHSIYPAGYHCDPQQPLPFAGLASQKGHMSLYLMGLYVGGGDGKAGELVKWFEKAWAASGKKKLDMGKACVRFKSVEDVPLEVIGEVFRRLPVKAYIAEYERVLNSGHTTGNKAPAKRANKVAKKAVKKGLGKARAAGAKRG